MSLVNKIDGLTGWFQAEVEERFGKLPNETVRLVDLRTTALRAVFKRLDRAATQISYCERATALATVADNYRAVFRGLSLPGSNPSTAGADPVPRLLKEVDGLLGQIDDRVNDPAQVKVDRLELMRVPLMLFAEDRTEPLILTPKELLAYQLRVTLKPARATRDWLQQRGKNRESGLKQAILEGIEPVRRAATDYVMAQDKAMAAEGPSPRRDRLKRVAPTLAAMRAEFTRAASKAIRRWYRRQLKSANLRTRYPLGEEARWRGGEAVFIEEVADASETLAYELRMYKREVRYLYEEVARDMDKRRRNLQRPLPDFYETATAVLEKIESEAGDTSLLGALRNLASSFSSGLGASFSNVDEAIKQFRSDGKRLLSTVRKGLDVVEDAPGRHYMASLRRRRTPELARAAQHDKKTRAMIGALKQLQAGSADAADELIEAYGQLVELLKDLDDWARSNEDESARSISTGDLRNGIDDLLPFVEGDFLPRHSLLLRTTKEWKEAADKILLT